MLKAGPHAVRRVILNDLSDDVLQQGYLYSIPRKESFKSGLNI
jgi:hypothetical protein